MATTTTQMGSFYSEKLATSELRKYREKGPIPSTRALIEALNAEGVEGSTLLDVGGGIGAIQHELLAAGVASATSADASAPYLAAAREESDRRGHGGRVTYLHGDFVELAESVPPADIVTLDRVINVYPDWQRLVEVSAEHAQRLYGLVYPRDRLMVRLVIFTMNLAHERVPKAGARLRASGGRDRPTCAREGSHSPVLSQRRAGVAGGGLPPPLNSHQQRPELPGLVERGMVGDDPTLGRCTCGGMSDGATRVTGSAAPSNGRCRTHLRTSRAATVPRVAPTDAPAPR